jgi:hypothetical protein
MVNIEFTAISNTDYTLVCFGYKDSNLSIYILTYVPAIICPSVYNDI